MLTQGTELQVLAAISYSSVKVNVNKAIGENNLRYAVEKRVFWQIKGVKFVKCARFTPRARRATSYNPGKR